MSIHLHNNLPFVGEVKAWQLTLYGTATPPAYDLRQSGGTTTFSEMYNEEISHNSIDDTSSNWKGGAEVSSFNYFIATCLRFKLIERTEN